MIKTIKLFLTPIALLVSAFPIQAAIVYQCPSARGGHVYTQDPSTTHCRRTNLGRSSSYTPTSVATTAQEQPKAAVPQSVNKVDPTKLQAAQERLATAQKNLNEGKQIRYGNERNYALYQERIAGLEAAVAEAEKQLNDLQQ